MSKKRFLLEIDEEVINEHLIAIHTHKEAYQIAFYLNQTLDAKLKRTLKDLENKKGSFIQFEWIDTSLDLKCVLFSNKHVLEHELQNTNNLALFELPMRNEVYLIPKLKKVDFFIKSTNNQSLGTIELMLKNWTEVSLTYRVAMEKFINQLNLIFD
jgi:hypothetical protein